MQGEVSVRMGQPLIDGDHVAAEFWATATSEREQTTIAGCLIARLGPDGRCRFFREYWFDVEGHADPYDGWGEWPPARASTDRRQGALANVESTPSAG